MFPVSDTAGIESAVNRFMRYVNGPVDRWFGDRDTMHKLIDMARVSTARVIPENFPPPRVRGTVLLSVVNNRTEDAAALMEWYLHRDHFNRLDSLRRASAFDAVLRHRFPDYAQARDTNR
ncbi:hypothetical protein ACIRRA_08480 [Nocardia sp. NPDC101769]|uniref:hypothetical protein n=1 Tax=Nocardia sp. NPDC101769 TaxID=3364333 RepID=UPI00380A2DCE